MSVIELPEDDREFTDEEREALDAYLEMRVPLSIEDSALMVSVFQAACIASLFVAMFVIAICWTL